MFYQSTETSEGFVYWKLLLLLCKNRGKNIYWLWARGSRPTVRRDPCIGSQFFGCSGNQLHNFIPFWMARGSQCHQYMDAIQQLCASSCILNILQSKTAHSINRVPLTLQCDDLARWVHDGGVGRDRPPDGVGRVRHVDDDHLSRFAHLLSDANVP